MRYACRLLTFIGLIASIYAGILTFPEATFAHHITYKNYEIWSDRPIDPAITAVLEDATRRIERSELYNSTQKFHIFFCNSSWRLGLYDMLFDTRLSGATDTMITRNVFIRESNIAANQIVPSPEAQSVLDLSQRPLSYFLAHEMTHVMESRAFGRLMVARFPLWLNEGYADYIGKGGDFDFDENRNLLQHGDQRLDPERSGLYRRYNLEVALLLDKENQQISEIYNAPPIEADLLQVLRNNASPDADSAAHPRAADIKGYPHAQ